jgi:acyl-CoA reductase-like NAD-dependent aldehyde dehydrogenase
MMTDKINVTSPYSGELLESIPLEDETTVFKKLDIAYAAFTERDNWLSKVTRHKILINLIHLMSDQRMELAKLATSEGGKPLKDSLVEVDRAIQGVRVALHTMETITGEMIPMGQTLSSENRIAYTLKEPLGVVLSVSAFNHPLNLIIHQVIPAVAVGSPVLIKPSKTTPLSCFKLVEILLESGLPKAWCQTLFCKNEIINKLIKDERVQFLSFIGSASVGWHLRSILAPGARCALEHGGSAPVIVEKDANIEELLPALLKAGFYHAGQVCVSAQRVYVHESLIDTVVKGVIDGAKQLKLGDPLNIKTDVGPLISTTECTRIETWVNEAIDKGATLLCGGKKIGDSFFEPTALLNPSAKCQVSSKEIFGPVVCFYPFTERSQAIDNANDLPFSFQASIYSQNMDIILDSINRLKADAVMVNDHPAFRVDWMPFGGSEHSGLGTGGIPYSMNDMMKEKLVVIKSKEI